jgi:hypothetical protein
MSLVRVILLAICVTVTLTGQQAFNNLRYEGGSLELNQPAKFV